MPWAWGLTFVVVAVSAVAVAAPASAPHLHWSVKTTLPRTGEEKTQALPEGAFSLSLSTGHRCDFTATNRAESPAAILFTRVMACASPENPVTTGTTATCSVPRAHGVPSMAEPGKWFVFVGKDGTPLHVTLSCGFLP